MESNPADGASWGMNNTPPRGTSLIELVVALALLSIVLLVAVPASAALRDRASVRSASTELAAALALARSVSVAEARVTAVRLDTASGTAVVLTPTDTLIDLPLAARYGVGLSATRDSLAYGPTGRGYGAANTTLTLRRGRASDTIVISRLGRVRY
ncbi:MAG TPA: GspH/FimT family pseudopilin [Gemmatimonadaceae bacterium]|nr:GspH/FimT family pseudopilin [Gemmatimonadaceae bacterium]